VLWVCVRSHSSRLASTSTSLWLLLLQVYTIVTATLDNSLPPGRTAVCELLEKLQEPVAYMQELFQPISSRVSQVGADCSCCSVQCHACICRVMSTPHDSIVCASRWPMHMCVQKSYLAEPVRGSMSHCCHCCMVWAVVRLHACASCPATSQCTFAVALLAPVRSWSWPSVQCWIMWLQLQCWSALQCLMCRASGRRSWESRDSRRSAHSGRCIAWCCC
jgi:hypothetical protein